MADESKPLGTADEMQKLMDAAARGRCDGDGPADVTDEYKAAHATPVAMRAAASNEAIDLAESHVGEDGATFWDWYFGGGYVNGARTPWCACFVSWCLDKLGVSCAGIPSSYVPAIQTAAADAGKALSPTDAIEGDVIIFDWNKNGVGDHIGFCVANHDGWMDTVEGNVSNSVGNRSRYHSDVLMAIRPAYTTPVPAPSNTNINKRREHMEFIIANMEETGAYVYVNGDKMKDLTDPDDITILNTAHNICYGCDIPITQIDSPDAPWSSRLWQVLYAGAPTADSVPGLRDFQPRSPLEGGTCGLSVEDVTRSLERSTGKMRTPAPVVKTVSVEDAIKAMGQKD